MGGAPASSGPIVNLLHGRGQLLLALPVRRILLGLQLLLRLEARNLLGIRRGRAHGHGTRRCFPSIAAQ
jgi:hypothetical protein